jgi:hypothetical protein
MSAAERRTLPWHSSHPTCIFYATRTLWIATQICQDIFQQNMWAKPFVPAEIDTLLSVGPNGSGIGNANPRTKASRCEPGDAHHFSPVTQIGKGFFVTRPKAESTLRNSSSRQHGGKESRYVAGSAKGPRKASRQADIVGWSNAMAERFYRRRVALRGHCGEPSRLAPTAFANRAPYRINWWRQSLVSEISISF